MISENRWEMFMFELATVIIGAVTVPVYAGYLPRQIAYLLGHARPKWVVASGKHQLGKIEKDRHPGVRRYFGMDYDVDCDWWGAEDYGRLVRNGGASALELDERIKAVQPDDLCVVMYTSGTTGHPLHRHPVNGLHLLSIHPHGIACFHKLRNEDLKAILKSCRLHRAHIVAAANAGSRGGDLEFHHLR